MLLTKKQQKAIEYLIRDKEIEYLGYGGAAGGGKTYIGCYWIMVSGLLYPGSKYFIGRDRLKDTRASVLMTWGKLSKQMNFDNYWTYRDNQIIFHNGSLIDFIDLTFYPQKDPMFERYGSTEYTAGWIEEAGQVHHLAFEVLKTRIGRWMNKEHNIKKKILCTFNPKKNWVDTTFYRPFKKGPEDKDTRFIFALPTDNPYLPADYIETLRNLKDESTKQRLLFGNFDYDDDPTALIDYQDILNLYSNAYVNSGKKYIVADIARFGSDKAVIMVWDGLRVIHIKTFDTSSTTDIQNAIEALRVKYSVPISQVIVDQDGVGGGVQDTLKCRGFINAGKPRDKQYQNNKTECGYKLAETIKDIWIQTEVGESIKEAINQELAQLKTYEADKDGKLRILPKEKIKDNIGRSPDYLDCFIMRMWFEINSTGYMIR